ncbi:hypothetical protein [Parasitella parasitica]|uniref:Uncharacterized protein n=1 Tax=Parasitella parasitica TaxID=35722 RepID=A0A0B7NG84_9FUNG|nr:hypothetical protein [Parasitella parasitica]
MIAQSLELPHPQNRFVLQGLIQERQQLAELDWANIEHFDSNNVEATRQANWNTMFSWPTLEACQDLSLPTDYQQYMITGTYNASTITRDASGVQGHEGPHQESVETLYLRSRIAVLDAQEKAEELVAVFGGDALDYPEIASLLQCAGIYQPSIQLDYLKDRLKHELEQAVILRGAKTLNEGINIVTEMEQSLIRTKLSISTGPIQYQYESAATQIVSSKIINSDMTRQDLVDLQNLREALITRTQTASGLNAARWVISR